MSFDKNAFDILNALKNEKLTAIREARFELETLKRGSKNTSHILASLSNLHGELARVYSEINKVLNGYQRPHWLK